MGSAQKIEYTPSRGNCNLIKTHVMRLTYMYERIEYFNVEFLVITFISTRPNKTLLIH